MAVGVGVEVVADRSAGLDALARQYTEPFCPAGPAVVNGGEGVSISTGANTIGGSAPGARNVISGNALEGVRIYNSAGATVVQGNYIGTNAAGTAAVGNGGDGVHIMNAGNTIGGALAAERNVISGNALSGIHLLLGAADNNTIQGNYIGVNATATAVLGNLDLTTDERDAIQGALENMVRERAGGSGAAKLTNPVNIGVGTR